jgi:hypothetical protein
MISSDQRVWGFQVANIGEARAHPVPRNLQSWKPTLAKKTRNERNRASSPSDSSLTEVTANLHLVPV